MDAAYSVSYFKKVENILRWLTILNLTAYEWPKPACVKDGAQFDFIVVGGGTAGCLIASRLVETGNVSVLLIEAGTYPPLESDMSGLFPFLKDTKYDWNFTSPCNEVAFKNHKDNVIHMSQGKMLGGSGSSGYGGYGHGYPHDFSEWVAITNDSSWSWEAVLPIYRANEKLIDEKILKSHDQYYGTKGKIYLGKKYYKRNRNFFNALKEIGYDYHLDINPDHPIGFTNLMFNIGNETRQSTAHKFLSPLKHHPNLYLLINTLATKLIFDNKKTAIGVEVITEDNKILRLKAKKEVIVTAGTIKSPQLLMLSGIGPKHHLENKGIKVVADLPVGYNFQDHINSILVYKMTKASLASNLGDPYQYPYVVFDGYVALNKSQRYPDYETICAHFGDSLTFEGLCAFFFSYNDEFCDTLNKGLDNKEALLVFITYLNPLSRGQILLTSTDPRDYPLIIPNYYSNSIDVDKHASYVADFNRVLNSTYFKQVEAELVDPKLKSCEGLERGTKEYWKCYTVGTADTAHYFVGTCAMGSVLDSKLRVYGVKNLRVADASVMPTNVRGLPQGTVMMIARKAADMIIKEHGLK
uniref:Glucose-methanol-choline oxidoreductase N-terminal domain-containing protein n=1 Tax=Heliothis virescens TaxID=7102 RepID=A0A2A4JSK9_HELVI